MRSSGCDSLYQMPPDSIASRGGAYRFRRDSSSRLEVVVFWYPYAYVHFSLDDVERDLRDSVEECDTEYESARATYAAYGGCIHVKMVGRHLYRAIVVTSWYYSHLDSPNGVIVRQYASGYGGFQAAVYMMPGFD